MLAAAEEMVADLDLEFLTATLSEKGIALVRPGNRLIAPAWPARSSTFPAPETP